MTNRLVRSCRRDAHWRRATRKNLTTRVKSSFSLEARWQCRTERRALAPPHVPGTPAWRALASDCRLGFTRVPRANLQSYTVPLAQTYFVKLRT